MYRDSFFQRVIVVGLLTTLLASGSAFAQRGDRGRGGGGGDRSSSRGDGGSRSFSRGDGGGSSRSFSSGSGRSWSGGDSSRFSRGPSESSSRSFRSSPSRSFSEGSRSSSPSVRSFEGSRSFSRPSEGSSSSPRTFSGQPSRSFENMRSSSDAGDRGATSRSYRGPSSDNADRGTVQRSFDRSASESPQFSRRFEGDSNRSRGEFDRSRDASGRPESSNRRDYVAGRPTDDQVRDFLRMREDGSRNQAGNAANQPGGANLGQRRLDGNFDRGSNRGANDGRPDSGGPESFRNRVIESQNEGDRAWSRRFGGGENNRGDAGRGDQTARNDNNGRRAGDVTRRPGDVNRSTDGRGDSGRDFTRDNTRQRDFGDRQFVDSKYQSWKKGAWHGDDDGKGRDHRDWSGRWKDGDRFVAARNIRDHWDRDWDRDRDWDDFPFHSGWKHHRWHGHGGWNRWNYWDHWAIRYQRPWYWWGWTTAPYLTSWVNFGWNTPYYWDYGPGEYIYCDDNVIYVNGRWFQPAPIYYENTVALAEQAPDWTPEQAQQVEWLPLGVFAVARDGVADKNLLIQLAVTKDGVIGGTATNQLTGVGFPIEGTVDKQTQRAVWTYTDDKNARIVMETSVYNLTQPEATGLVHYSPEDIQVVELVRLEKPDAGAAPAAAPAATAPTELPTP